jgi:phosphoglycerol transferase
MDRPESAFSMPRTGPDPGWRDTAWRAVAAYAGAALLCMAILTVVLQLWRADLTVPLYDDPDCGLVQMCVKGQVDNPWFLHNAYLGAPHGLEMDDFPYADGFHYLVLKLLALVFRDYAVVLNVYFLLTFPLATLTALFVLRRFHVSYAPALVAALLFAFLPYHFFRNQSHIFLVSYYPIPLAVMVALWLYLDQGVLFARDPATGKTTWRPGSRRSIAAVLVCLLVSSGGVYYAFFTCFFLAVAGAAGSLFRRRPHPLVAALLLAGVVCLGVLVNVAPALVYRWRHGPNPEAVGRSVLGCEMYALRIIQLLLPVPGHRLPLFAQAPARYQRIGLPFLNENQAACLGLIGSVGFLYLLGRLLNQPRRPGRRHAKDGLCILTVFALLLGCMGGFGFAFGMTVSPLIRAYNRVSIYLAFFALFAVALILERLARHCTSPRARRLFHAGLAVLLAAGVLDLTTPAFVPAYGQAREEFRLREEFVRRIEDAVPEGALIFQLPYMPFPESSDLALVRPYDHGTGYLHGRRLRWSFGSMRGRDGDLWQQQASALPPEELVQTLALAGFSGIYLDRYGFPETWTVVEAQFSELLGRPLVDARGRRSFFNLTAYRQRLQARCGPAEWDARRDASLHPVLVRWGRGFTGPEKAPPGRWCSGQGRLELDNPSPRPRTVTLHLTCRTERPGPIRLRLESPWFEAQAEVGRQASTLTRTFTIGPGRHALRMAADVPHDSGPAEGNRRVFRVDRCYVQEGERLSALTPTRSGSYTTVTPAPGSYPAGRSAIDSRP